MSLALAILLQGELLDIPERNRTVDSPFGSMFQRQVTPKLDADWVRFGVSWPEVEPREGEFRWEQFERGFAGRRDLRPMPVLRLDECWATRRREGPVPPGADSPPSMPPRDLTETWDPDHGHSRLLYNFVHALVERFRGHIPILVVENKATADAFWGGTPEEYVRVLKTAAKAAHEADPEILVADSGCPSGTWGFLIAHDRLAAGADAGEILAFLRGYYAQHPLYRARVPGSAAELRRLDRDGEVQGLIDKVALYFDNFPGVIDVLNFHYYEDPRYLPEVVAWLRAEIRERGADLPLLANEFGIHAPDGLDHETHARELAKRIVVALSQGVRWFAWFPHDHRLGPIGLYDPRTRELRAAPIRAFNTLAAAIGDARVFDAREEPAPGVEVYWFRDRASGARNLAVVWSGETVEVNVPAPEGRRSAVLRRLDGTESPAPTETGRVAMGVGPTPVLILFEEE